MYSATFSWRALLATMLFAGSAFAGDIRTHYNTGTGRLVVNGLSLVEQNEITRQPQRVYLQRANAKHPQSMLLSVEPSGDGLQIVPRFKLRAGESYLLRLSLSDAEPYQTKFSLAKKQHIAPKLVGFFPKSDILAANTLRFYLEFSQPMARGQVRKHIRLMKENGQVSQSPFLNLAKELWDPSQKRLTLILDPGRLKQGVGPNQQVGSPLESGNAYSLVVAGMMKSVDGTALGQDVHLRFQVGVAIRRALSPEAWRISDPIAGTQVPLRITFDRTMDVGATKRLIWIIGPDGKNIRGIVRTDGASWNFTPREPWAPKAYRLVVSPALEDIAGNSIRSAFDAKSGAMGIKEAPTELKFSVRDQSTKP